MCLIVIRYAIMYRSALDELAGRGGRGPEDDPLRLTARGLLQFLRARGREKSLAAAPADLLPASIVCQVCMYVNYIAVKELSQ